VIPLLPPIPSRIGRKVENPDLCELYIPALCIVLNCRTAQRSRQDLVWLVLNVPFTCSRISILFSKEFHIFCRLIDPYARECQCYKLAVAAPSIWDYQKRGMYSHTCAVDSGFVGRILDRISYAVFLQIARLNLCSCFVQGDAASLTKKPQESDAAVVLRITMCYSWLMLNLDCKPSRCDAYKLRPNFSPVAHLPMRRPRDCSFGRHRLISFDW
jgi:hypothetical protein